MGSGAGGGGGWHQEFKVSLNYLLNSRPSWLYETLSQRQTNTNQTKITHKSRSPNLFPGSGQPEPMLFLTSAHVDFSSILLAWAVANSISNAPHSYRFRARSMALPVQNPTYSPLSVKYNLILEQKPFPFNLNQIQSQTHLHKKMLP